MEAKDLEVRAIDVLSFLVEKGLKFGKVGVMDWGSYSVGFSWDGQMIAADGERFGASYDLNTAANLVINRYILEPTDNFESFIGVDNMRAITEIFNKSIETTPLLPSGSQE